MSLEAELVYLYSTAQQRAAPCQCLWWEGSLITRECASWSCPLQAEWTAWKSGSCSSVCQTERELCAGFSVRGTEALLGVGHKRRWVTSQQWNVHHEYFYPAMASFSQVIRGVKLVQSSWGCDALWPDCVRICASEIWSKLLKGVSLTSLWSLSLHMQEEISKD